MTEPTAYDVLAEVLREVNEALRDLPYGLVDDPGFVIEALAARGYALSSQPEAAGEAGLRAALTALPRQSIPDDGNIGRHNAGQWREASGYVEVVGLSAALAALALPEPER